MPEAPEVEAMVRALRPIVEGCTIRSARVVHSIAIKPQTPRFFAAHVQSRRIDRVTRHGKYLLLQLSDGVLVLHFKFDGQLILFDREPAASVHVDVFLHLDRGILGFVDPRHLGRILWYPDENSSPGLRHLGLDVFSKDFTLAAMSAALRKTKKPIKIALSDQTRMAGIGNIYSSESLWEARINPRKPADRLTAAELRRLHNAVVAVLRRALRCCSNPPPNFREAGWWFADLGKILRVYQREGQPCRRCGHAIRRMAQATRSTYFCPRCQR